MIVTRKSFSFCLLAIVACTFAIYYPSLFAGFAADDYLWLKKNSLTEIINYFHSSWGHGLAYRPIVRLSFTINAAISETNPLGWHITNIIIHGLNGVLVFVLSHKVLFVSINNNLINVKWTKGTFFPLGIALLASLLFISAPNLYSNVTWVSARTHSLATTFFLLASYTYFLNKRTFLTIALFILTMCCYESMAIFPMLISLIAFIGIYSKLADTQQVTYSSVIKKFILTSIALALFLLLRQHFLGIYTVEVSSNQASNIKDYLQVVIDFYHSITKFNRWIEPALLICVICALALKKYRVAILGFIVGGLIIIAPYMPASEAPPRFTYLFTAYCCIFLPILLFNLLEKYRLWTTFVCILLVYSCLYNASKSYEYAQGSRDASKLAEEVLVAVSKEIETLPMKGKLYFAGIPVKYKKGWVHSTYFGNAVKRYMKQENSNATLYCDFNWVANNKLLKMAKPNDFYFVYRKNRIIRLTKEKWFKQEEVAAVTTHH